MPVHRVELDIFNLLFISNMETIRRNGNGYTILLNKPKYDIIAFKDFREDIKEETTRTLKLKARNNNEHTYEGKGVSTKQTFRGISRMMDEKKRE